MRFDGSLLASASANEAGTPPAHFSERLLLIYISTAPTVPGVCGRRVHGRGRFQGAEDLLSPSRSGLKLSLLRRETIVRLKEVILR